MDRWDKVEYTVDRIEGNYALLEDSDTKKIIEVPLDSLPKKIIEGEILTLIDEIYQKDNQKYLDRMDDFFLEIINPKENIYNCISKL